MKAELVVLTQGLCSPDLLQVLGASEMHRPENQGMLELLKLPLLEAFVSHGVLGSTFLVWESPWNGCVPGSVCNSLLSSAVPLIFLVIVSSWFLYFISPFFFFFILSPIFFSFFLIPYLSTHLPPFAHRPPLSHSYHCHVFFLLPFLFFPLFCLLKFTLFLKPKTKSSSWGKSE